jgi:50S ribosomal protein L16 3-hydroxylase
LKKPAGRAAPSRARASAAPPRGAAARPAPLEQLGTLGVDDFVARYWQRRALCIRQALAGFRSPIGVDALLGLAADPDVESRLVSARAGRWQLRHGPFSAGDLPARRRRGWTLLVQGVDLHDAAVAQLAARFRFLPAARFDDVMISYATDGGGVGPHVDQYDVFLLQAWGRRRWRIARRFDPTLVDGLPLRVLARFAHEDEWILEPGDALYLPPGVAHEGVALGQCLTISIGFRLPAWQEIADAWHDRQSRLLGAAHAPDARLPDRTRSATRSPGRVPASMVDAASRELARIAPTRRQTARTLLEHLTEPKDTVIFEPPKAALGPARFRQAAMRRGLRLDLRSRMLFAGADVAINGELAVTTRAMSPALRRLANQGWLEPDALSVAARAHARRDARGVASGGANSDASDHATRGCSGPADVDAVRLLDLLHVWYRAGWLHLAA